MRSDSYSALDFMYWVLENVEENYTSIHIDDVYAPTDDDTIMFTLVSEMAAVCGVGIPRNFSGLMSKVRQYGSSISTSAAFRTRGAIVHRASCMTVCLGDEKRAVGANADGYISIYELGINEKKPGYWDGAFLIPEMRYL